MRIRILLSAACLWFSANLFAQHCELPVSIVLDEEFTDVPAAASSMLYQSLSRMATENGLTTEAPNSPFVLTAHCDVLDKSNLPGPPIQTVYNLGLTLYMVDTYQQKKFATAYLTLNGVGTGEVKSYIDAFRHISRSGNEIKKLVNTGRAKMMNYYDTQYPNILKEAKRLEAMQQYEEALAMVFAIPVCSKGGDQASSYGLKLYTRNLDRLNLYLLNTAKAMWAAGQDAQTAKEVCKLLAQIDPEAACYADASRFLKEVKGQVRSDIDFEMRQKYNDQIDLEKGRIAAARAVGVAFGNGQKPTTTNLMWLK